MAVFWCFLSSIQSPVCCILLSDSCSDNVNCSCNFFIIHSAMENFMATNIKHQMTVCMILLLEGIDIVIHLWGSTSMVRSWRGNAFLFYCLFCQLMDCRMMVFGHLMEGRRQSIWNVMFLSPYNNSIIANSFSSITLIFTSLINWNTNNEIAMHDTTYRYSTYIWCKYTNKVY